MSVASRWPQFLGLLVVIVVLATAATILGTGPARVPSPETARIAPAIDDERDDSQAGAPDGVATPAQDPVAPGSPASDALDDLPDGTDPTLPPPVDPGPTPQPPTFKEPTPDLEPIDLIAPVVVSADMADELSWVVPVGTASLRVLEVGDAGMIEVAVLGGDVDHTTIPIQSIGYRAYAIEFTMRDGRVATTESSRNDHVAMSALIGPEGGELRASNGEVALRLPGGAYSSPTQVSVSEVEGEVSSVGILRLAGVYDITPSGTLALPATLSIRYSVEVEHFQVAARLLAAAGMMTLDEMSGTWVDDATDVELTEDGYLSGSLEHFSYWTLAAIQPHGTSPARIDYCDDICHNLSEGAGSAVRLEARDSAVCYNCHGNESAAMDPAGASGANVQASFYQCDGQSLPLGGSTHPVATGDLYCTTCHNPHGDPDESPGLLRSYDALTGKAVTSGNAYCWTCHGTAKNRRIEALMSGYWASAGGDRKTGYDPGDLAAAETTAGITCLECHFGHGSDGDGLVKATMGPFTPEGTPTHAGVSHDIAGPCISSGCHMSDASVIHASIGCQACHAAETTTSFACRSCHAGDQHPAADHDNDPATQCDACHAETDLMSVHGEDCGKCHSTGANLTYSGGCSQAGCHSGTHVDAWEDQEYWVGHSVFGVAHGDYGGGAPPDSCWSCHAGNGEIFLGAACTTPYCHPDVYERVAPVTTSNAVAGYTGVALINLTATDVGTSGYISGVRETYYRVSGGPLEKGTSVLITPPASGTRDYTLEFWSLDNNLNSESPHSVSFTVAAGGTPDTSPPSGTMSLNSGAAYAASRTLSVNSSVSDPDSGVSMMRVDPGTGNWGAWMPYAAIKPVTVSSDGPKTVRVEYRNGWGVSTVLSDTITVDTTGPSGSVIINGGAAWTDNTAVTLSLSASDILSTVTSMRFSNDGSSWSTWEGYQATKSWTLAGANGTKTVYVQYRDSLGNAGPVGTDTIAYFVGTDTTPPTGTIQINGGAPYTTTPAVTLTLSATDTQTGVVQMRLSNDNTNWTTWEPYVTSKAWTLSSGMGNKYVYVQYRDGQGNQSTSKLDLIVYDAAPPTGTVTINDTAGITDTRAVVLSLHIADTGGSGYREGAVRFSNDGVTWTAWEDWIQWQNDQFRMSRLWTLTAGDGIKTVHVQYRDRAGNVSTVVTDTTTATWVANNKATLAFRWLSGDWGWADLHVENSVGTTIAETEVSGSGDQLAWVVAVPAGQDYRMVCDGWAYYDGEDYVPYGIWSNNATINPDGILSVGEAVIWDY